MKLRALILVVGIFAGCAGPPPPRPAPFAAAETASADVQWRGPAGALAGRMTFERGAGGALRLTVRDEVLDGARYTAGVQPVIRLGEERLTLTRQRGEWSARGPLVGRPWRGVGNVAPARIAGWLDFAEAVEGAHLAADGERDVRTGRYSLRSEKRGGRLAVAEVVVVATGDRFRAIFL